MQSPKDVLDSSKNNSVRAGHQPTGAARSRLLTHVIAVVGSDGSGKSTLTADLYGHLRDSSATQLLYLGQDSGNILRFILGIPLVGAMLGQFLQRKSQSAHADGDKKAEPDKLTAIVIYLLSRWRAHKFRQMLKLHRRGTTIICDRYPQAEAASFYFDGPGLIVTEQTGTFIRWLAAREARLYQKMAEHVPALIIRLNIDAETAHRRKPDHKLKVLQEKTRVIPTLTFNGATILDLDATTPYPEILKTTLAEVHKALDAKQLAPNQSLEAAESV